MITMATDLFPRNEVGTVAGMATVFLTNAACLAVGGGISRRNHNAKTPSQKS